MRICFSNQRTAYACLVMAVVGCAVILSCALNQDLVMTPPWRIAGADYVGTDTCAFCHERIGRAFPYTDHARLHITGDAERLDGQGCEMCHGAGSLHVEAGGGRGVHIINPRTNPETCYHCHTEIRTWFNLQYHHPLREGRISCINCHDSHGITIYRSQGTLIASGQGVCAECHREQARPHVFEHEALREGCVTCHQVHGSIGEKLLVASDNNLCLRCHGQVSPAGTLVIGEVSHTPRVMQGTCWSADCHTAVHGSDINSHLRY